MSFTTRLKTAAAKAMLTFLDEIEMPDGGAPAAVPVPVRTKMDLDDAIEMVRHGDFPGVRVTSTRPRFNGEFTTVIDGLNRRDFEWFSKWNPSGLLAAVFTDFFDRPSTGDAATYHLDGHTPIVVWSDDEVTETVTFTFLTAKELAVA